MGFHYTWYYIYIYILFSARRVLFDSESSFCCPLINGELAEAGPIFPLGCWLIRLVGMCDPRMYTCGICSITIQLHEVVASA